MSNTNDYEAQPGAVRTSVKFNVGSLLALETIAPSSPNNNKKKNASAPGDGFFHLRPNEEKLNQRIRQCIMECDKNGDGEIDGEEFISLIKVAMKDRAAKNNLHKVVIMCVVSLLLLLVTTFCSSLAVIIMTRQLTLDSDSGLMVSQSTGKAVSTHAVGGGGIVVPMLPFTDTYVDDNGDSQTYRELRPILGEDSPTGQDLQCMGLMPRSNLDSAVYFSMTAASSVRMVIPNELEPGDLVLPLDMNSLLRRSISHEFLEDTRRLTPVFDPKNATLDVESLQKFDYPAIPVISTFQQREVQPELVITVTHPGFNPDILKKNNGDLGGARRHLQASYLTSDEWYSFLASPTLQVFVCLPEFTGGIDSLCLYCGVDDSTVTATTDNAAGENY